MKKKKISDIEYAIFDMDGTIVDSMYAWDTAADRLLLSMGITPFPETRDDIRTMTTAEVAKYFDKKYSLDIPENQLAHMFNRTMEDFYENEATFKEGALELLTSLHEKGVGMCVATATDRYMAEGVLKKLGVYHLFDFMVTCTEVGKGKSSPLVFDVCLERCGADKDKVWIFEDSFFAIKTAKDFGYHVLAVYDKSNEPFEKDKEACADIYVNSLKELEIG